MLKFLGQAVSLDDQGSAPDQRWGMTEGMQTCTDLCSGSQTYNITQAPAAAFEAALLMVLKY